MLGSIPSELDEVFEAATLGATIFEPVTDDDVSGDGDALFSIGKVDSVGVARVENVVG